MLSNAVAHKILLAKTFNLKTGKCHHEKNFDKKIWIDNEQKRCDFYSPSEMHDSAVEDDFTGVSLFTK